MDKQKIIDKVIKLMSLASSSNENEANAAADMAYKLMLRHNISKSEIKEEQDKDDYVDVDIDHARSIPRLMKVLSDILDEYYMVTTYYNSKSAYVHEYQDYWTDEWKSRVTKQRHLRIYGSPENVAIATHVYKFLYRTFQELWREYKRKNDLDQSERDAYYVGLARGLALKLELTKKKVEQEYGLVPVDAKLEEYTKNMGVLGGSAPPRANLDGVRDGAKITIHKVIETKEDNVEKAYLGTTSSNRQQG
jgi:hypothetical protein